MFADTGWEPPSVYEHLDWLQEQLSFEVVRVQAGNIKDNILEGTSPDGNNYLGIPAFLLNADGSTAVAARQCTSKYKVRPINRYLRERLGFEPGRRAPKHVQVEIWMGISADEVLRQKESREEWATNRYPLIELGFSRAQLLNWFTENYPDRYLPQELLHWMPVPHRWRVEVAEDQRARVIRGGCVHRPRIAGGACGEERDHAQGFGVPAQD